jgi:two-component system, OmpR family, phosphate regulon response regulator PhoB
MLTPEDVPGDTLRDTPRGLTRLGHDDGVTSAPRSCVLVIDDDRDVRSMINVILQGVGFDVYGRADGVTAVNAALSLRPDVVILDWMLADGSGLDVCASMRRRRELERTGILMISGKGADEDVRSGLNAGADRYLIKPLIPRTLIRHVEELAFG